MSIGDFLCDVLIKSVKGIANYLKEESEKQTIAMDSIQNKSMVELKNIISNENADYYKRRAAQKILNIKNEQELDTDRSSNAESIGVSKRTTPAYREGNDKKNKTTIVLSAPGKAEKIAGRPAAGKTGKTLQKAVEKLNKRDPEKFPSKKLDDYTIINASKKIEYLKGTGRTESSNKEIESKDNIARVEKLLKGSENVLALGNKAKIVVSKTNYNGTIIEGEHPSMQAINRKYKSGKSSAEKRSDDRIEQWTNEILKNDKE